MVALALGATGYAVGVLAASIHPGPRAWGLHLPGFLPPVPRAGLIAVPFAAAVMLWLALVRPAPDGAPMHGHPSGQRSKTGARRRRSSRAWIGILCVYGVLLLALRSKTHFLGDGIVWLNQLTGGEAKPFGEPLATAVWRAFANFMHVMGRPVGAESLGLLPVACGVVAAIIARQIVREVVQDHVVRRVAWILVITLGASQLYFGYIESYPVVCVAILAYLWLALRCARGADPPWLCGIALAVAIATHIMTLFLLPSYVLALARTDAPWTRRLALLAIPLAAAPLLLLAVGTTPSDWLVPFRTAAQGFFSAHGGDHLNRPYPWASLDHASDVANAVLLAIPVPALLLLSLTVAERGRIWPRSEPTLVLATAAVCGLIPAAALSLPVAPAQDWDLTAVLLLPLGIAGIVAARFLCRAPLVGAALIVLSASSLFAFVLVNANQAAGVARYETLLAPGSRITPYGRGYGNSTLSEFFEDRGDLPSALRFAEAAIDAEPTNARYWMRAGTILYNEGNYGEAIAKLEEALRRGVTRSGARYNLGLCYARTGRYAEALVQFRSAIEMEGDRPDYRQSLGVALYEAGQPDSARQVWTEVLKRWPDYAPTIRSMERRFGETAHP